MNTNFKHSGTDKEPSISASMESGVIEISGRSIPEDAKSFYLPFKNWISEIYSFTDSVDQIVMKIDLDYLNTSSSKFFLELMQEMKLLAQKKKVEIIWYYEEGDDEMMETGMDFQHIVGDVLELSEKKI